MGRRILIIPSWYPRPGLPLGTFFQEQAAFAAEDNDVRVMAVDVHAESRRSLAGLRSAARARVDRLSVEVVVRGRLTEGLATATYARPFLSDAEAPQRAAVLQVYAELSKDGWRPDVIHAHCASPAGVYAQFVSEKIGVPYVVTEHQHVIYPYFDRDDWHQNVAVYKAARAVAAVSQFQRQVMLMNDAGRTDIATIANLVDERVFTPKAAPEGEPPRVVCIATFTRLKDFETLGRATYVAMARTRRPFRLHLIIPDLSVPRRRELDDWSTRHGIAGVVDVEVNVARSRIPAILQGARAFLSTSIAETFGVAACEALMCGTPVVATKSGGVQDFIVDGVNGVLAEIGAADHLGMQLAEVLDAPARFNRMAVHQSVVGVAGTSAFRAKLDAFYAAASGHA